VRTKSIIQLPKHRSCHQIVATRQSSMSKRPRLIDFCALSEPHRLGGSASFDKSVTNHSVEALDHGAQPSIPSRITQPASAGPETPVPARSTLHAPEARKRKPSPSDEPETSPKNKRPRTTGSLPETPSPVIEEISS
jgi:hypothetical protein